MQKGKTRIKLTSVLTVVLACFSGALPLLAAGKEKVVHSFDIRTDGFEPPEAGVILDPAGNLYGTTFQGGTHTSGTAFEVKPR